jgi:Icc protein
MTIKFVHVSDLHLVTPGKLLWGVDPFARLQDCLADIAKHHADAAFCAISGDLTERGEIAAYEALRDSIEGFPIPVHLMLGNHDERNAFRTVFVDAPLDAGGFVQMAVRLEGAHFLMLDTLKGPPSSAGRYSDRRKQWLQEQLAAAAGAPVYIFMHHPPFDIAHPLMDKIKLDEAEDFAALLTGHNVKHFFFGHAHRTLSGQWRGIAFSAPPALAHQLPLVSASVPTVYSIEPAAYAVVHADQDRTIVHFDAFRDRSAADMAPDAERSDWF